MSVITSTSHQNGLNFVHAQQTLNVATIHHQEGDSSNPDFQGSNHCHHTSVLQCFAPTSPPPSLQHVVFFCWFSCWRSQAFIHNHLFLGVLSKQCPKSTNSSSKAKPKQRSSKQDNSSWPCHLCGVILHGPGPLPIQTRKSGAKFVFLTASFVATSISFTIGPLLPRDQYFFGGYPQKRCVLQCVVHVLSHFRPLDTNLVEASILTFTVGSKTASEFKTIIELNSICII